MTKFDKEIKKLSEDDIEIPSSYDEKLDNILQKIEAEEEIPGNMTKRKPIGKIVFVTVLCLICTVCFLYWGTSDSQANIIEFLKQTLVEFLQGDTGQDAGNLGVESKMMYMEGKQDLMLELQEVVIDTHSIYLLVKITAPANIKFTKEIGFEYYCFCRGENYSNNQLLGGARDCRLLEVDPEKPNIATYVLSQTLDEELEEGSNLTVSLQNMTKNPYSDHPKLLVEGMWSLTFPFQLTVKDHISIEGTPDMVFPYINTTAAVKSIELTPLGIVLFSDVSNFPDDERGVSDMTIAITLKMIDGEEKVIVTHDPDQSGFAQGGSISFSKVDGKTHQQDMLEFTEMVDISKVIGIYIENLYIPIE